MNDQPRRHQGWDEFQLLIAAGHPALVTVPGSPATALFVDSQGSRVGVRMDSSGSAPLSPLVEISVTATSFQGRSVLEVSTKNPALYREFYDFACSIADRAQLRHKRPTVAVEESLEAWGDLLQRISLLSVERELGLLGELWMITRLAQVRSYRQAVEAWRGSEAEEHDFGLPKIDVEVKTTTSERRVHSIASISQLVPSPKRLLYLLSVQLTRNTVASESWTLPDAIRDIRAQILGDPPLTKVFDAKLRMAGWVHDLASHYVKRFVLRSHPALVAVDARCPAITRPLIEQLGKDRATRVLAVRYEVDVTGLGVEDGTTEFMKVIADAGSTNA